VPSARATLARLTAAGKFTSPTQEQDDLGALSANQAEYRVGSNWAIFQQEIHAVVRTS
jgi:hypothetical protein